MGHTQTVLRLQGAKHAYQGVEIDLRKLHPRTLFILAGRLDAIRGCAQARISDRVVEPYIGRLVTTLAGACTDAATRAL